MRNLLAVSDKEFYLSNAESCANEARKYISEGNEFLAGFYAQRAAQYIFDFWKIA